MYPGTYIGHDGKTYHWDKLRDISTGKAMFSHCCGAVSVCIAEEDWPRARAALDTYVQFDKELEDHKKELVYKWSKEVEEPCH